MSNEWRMLVLEELPPLQTQTVYHAVALNQSKNNTPNTLILTWPKSPLVCIGIHQVANLVVEQEYIEKEKIPLVRRITGGGAVYLDQNQLFYQLIFKREDYSYSIEELFEYFLQPVVSTYRYLGIPAQFQPKNDIIALDKKISGNGAATIENSTVLVGNFILDFPAEKMGSILRVSDEKFRDKIIKTLNDRVGSIKHFLGYIPNKVDLIYNFKREFENILEIDLKLGELTEQEKQEINRLNKYYLTDEWRNYVENRHEDLFKIKIKSGINCFFKEVKTKSGLISLYVQVVVNKIQDIAITGDFFTERPFNISTLEKEILGVELSENELKQRIRNIYSNIGTVIEGVTAEELAKIIVNTISKKES